MKGILKWPLIVAAVVVVMRVVVERAGVSDHVSNYFSVVALHLVIAPLYFAIRIATSEVRRPYLTQIKLVVFYVVLTRALILPTYWAARIFGWEQGRFGGLSGSTPFAGYVTIPFQTAAAWIVISTCVGTVLGFVVIAMLSRFVRSNTTT